MMPKFSSGEWAAMLDAFSDKYRDELGPLPVKQAKPVCLPDISGRQLSIVQVILVFMTAKLDFFYIIITELPCTTEHHLR